MDIIEVFLIALGLSMDAFAVSVCLGLSAKKATLGKMLTVGAYFGIFQAVMPVIGYLAATLFTEGMAEYGHWIAFILLVFLGARMILSTRNEEKDEMSFRPSQLLLLAVATSIDALAVGVSFAFLGADMIPAAAVIGIVTFAVCAIGVRIGCSFGVGMKAYAELAGGIVLILIGVKILAEHYGLIPF